MVENKNILLVSPPFVAVPPKGYGGAERIVFDLIKAAPEQILYTLSAPSTSRVSCELKPNVDTPLFDDPTYNHATDRLERSLQSNKNIVEAAKHTDFDLIHSMDYENPHLLCDLQQFGKPILVSVHHARVPRIEKLISQFKDEPLIQFNMLSKNHAKSYSHLGDFPFIYNGLDIDRFEVADKKDPFILSVGDTKPIKGHVVASKIAKETGYDVVLAGAPAYPEAHSYFQKEIQPIIDKDLSLDALAKTKFIESIKLGNYVSHGGKTIYVGSVNDEEKKPLFSHASYLNALGHLESNNIYSEAFLLTAIEALLSKTKVLTTPSHPANEFLHLNSGYSNDSIEDVITSISEGEVIMSEEAFQYSKDTFSSEKMAKNYAKLYSSMLYENE